METVDGVIMLVTMEGAFSQAVAESFRLAAWTIGVGIAKYRY